VGKQLKILVVLVLALLLVSGVSAFAGGSGTSSDPYEISTCQHLQDMQNDLDASYELVSDVDCSSYSGFSSIRGTNPFTGELNGNGYIVNSLTIQESASEVGLISNLDGTVKNIGLESVNIEGNGWVGAIAGVGGDTGTISNSYSTGTVDGGNDDYVGGVLGGGPVHVVDSYSFASASGAELIGGLQGYGYNADIDTSYSVGAVTGSGSYAIGGLIGSNPNGYVSGSYWDTETSGQSSSDGGTGLTTSEMQGATPLCDGTMSNLDFSNTFYTRSDDYPGLRAFASNPSNLNCPPSLVVNSPTDGESGVTSDAELKVDISDANGDSMDVTFYNAPDDTQIGSTQTGVSDGGTASVTWDNLSAGNSYSWYAVADDGSATTTSSTWSFTVNIPPDRPSVNNPSDGVSGTDDSVNLNVAVNDPDGDSMDVCFYDSSDDSQIACNTGVADGNSTSVTWSGLSWGSQYSWYAVADDGKATNQSSTWSFTTQYAPDLISGKFVDDRTTSTTKLLFGIDDYGETDVDTWSGTGTLNSLTDSQLEVDIGLPLSSSYSVIDTFGATSNTYSVDVSETDSGVREDSYSHSLDTQRVNRTVTIFNDAAPSIDYELVLDLAGTVIQGQSWTGTISGSSSVTHTAVTESDWITGETESTYDRYSDSNYDHGEDQQRIHNRTQFVVDNSRSFSFTGVDLSGVCSETTSADIASGTGVQVTTDCNRPTFLVDKITQSAGSEYEDASYSHSLDTQGVAKNKGLTELSGSFSFNQVNISAPSISGSCFNCGQRQRDISAGATITEVYNATSDFISNEVESTYSKYSDSVYDHSEDQQRIVNRTQLDVDNERSFTFHDVDLSSKCNQVTSSDVPSGSSTLTTDCNRPTFLVDTISESVTEFQEDSTEQHDLPTQHGYKRKDLMENEGYSYSSVDISAPSLPGTCENCNDRNRDISGGATISEYYNSSSDWITGETESTYTKYSDSDHNHTEDGQRIHNRTQLVVDNSRSFTFHNVDLSSKCSQTSSADISPTTGFQVTNDCNRPTFNLDVLTTSVEEAEADRSKNHTEYIQYLKKNKTVSENGGYSWSNVSIFAPSLEGSCSECNTRTRDIPSTGSVTEVYHASGDWIEVNASQESSDSAFSHSLDSQRVYVAKNLTEAGGYNWDNVSISTPSINGSCENCGLRNISIDAGESTTEYYNASNDWIQNESESTTEIGQNTSIEAGIDQQTLYNQTQLKVNNTRSFGFSSVEVSSKCSTTTSVDVPSGENVVTSACNNDSFTGDWIKNEKNQSTEYVSGDIQFGKGLDTEYDAAQSVEVSNVRTSTDLQVNLDSLVSDVPGCSLDNSTTQNAPADSVSSFEFQKSCTPGQHLNRTPVVKTETDDFYKYEIEFGFEIHSNLTDEETTEYAVKSSWADNWNNRDPTETEALVDGSSKDIQIDERIINGTEYIVFQIGESHTNSSIHEGVHSASLTYYEDKTPGSTSGGGSSDGTSTVFLSDGSETQVEEVTSNKYNWTLSAITSQDSQKFQVSGYPGATFERYVVVRNTGDRNVTLDIECVSIEDECSWVETSVDRVVLNRNDFTEKQVKVNGTIPASFDESDAPAQFSIRVSDPEFNGSQSGPHVAYVDFTVTNSPVFGRMLDAAVKGFEVRTFESPVSWGHSLPYVFVLVPLFWSVLVNVLWSTVEWLVSLSERNRQWSTNLKWISTIAVFFLTYILL